MSEHPEEKDSLVSSGLSIEERGALTLASLDYLHEAISIFDSQLRLLVWNRRFIELLGFPPDLMRVGLSFAEMISYNVHRGEYGLGNPDQQVAERVHLARQFQSHQFERIRPNGTVLKISGEPIAGGGFITIYEDITDRKRADTELKGNYQELEVRVQQRTAELLALNKQLAQEVEQRKRIAAALHASENRIRLITDTVPALIASLDNQRRYEFVNQKHAEWFGLHTDVFIGRTFGEMLPSALAKKLQPHIDAALQGRSTHVEYDLVTPVARKYVGSYFIPHLPAAGETDSEKPVGCFVLSEDLTEYRQAQMALNQAQKLKAVGQLTGGIAHDFNNLLTIILGNLAVLEEGLQEQPEHQQTVQTVISAARRGADLTRRLLAFSSQQSLQPRLLSPYQQLHEIVELLGRTLGKGIELTTIVDRSVWAVQVDPGQLTNAVLNLAINARDAMSGKGQLRIEAANVTLDTAYTARYPDVVPGDYVRFAVSDTGCGMSADVLEQAFEPFFTTKDLGAGTGLGLSMVYGFIKQSGGHVRVHSRINEGTTVVLYLPRYVLRKKERTTGGVGAVPQRAQQLHGQERVLLVDDDAEVRRFVVRVLLGFGYTVHEASNGSEALALLATGIAIDLLLSDMTMPGDINGYELVRETRRQYPAIRILCMSGYIDQGGVTRLPADCTLLGKPFLKDDLARAVRLTLDQSASSDRLCEKHRPLGATPTTEGGGEDVKRLQ